MTGLVIFVVLTFITTCVCDKLNLIGSSITFSPGENNTVLVDYRLSWLCEMSGYHCLDPGQGNQFLPCLTDDNDTIHFPDITCTDTGSHMFDRWTSARGRLIYTPGQDQFLSSLSAGKISADLNAREDNGKINSSPTTDMIPVVMLQQGSKHRLKIPVGDVDGDLIKCGWSEVDLSNGCGHRCHGVIEATLDENKCELEYFANKAIGNYLVALQVEDFMSSRSTQPLSSVPLQFFVEVYNGDWVIEGSGDTLTHDDIDGALNKLPYFISQTPKDGECFEVGIYSLIELEIVATYTHRVRVNTIKPVGMTSSNISHTNNGTDIITSVNITWTPSDYDEDRFHIVCFYAYAYDNTMFLDRPISSTETRCIRIAVKGPDWISKGLSGLTCNVTECMLPVATTLNITYVGPPQQKYTFGDAVIYKCNRGYQFVNYNRDKDSVTCMETGYFAEFRRCARVECKLPDLSQLNINRNATRGKDSFYYGDIVKYECNQDYRFHDRERKKSVTCTETGMFEQFTECVKIPKCPDDRDQRGTYWNETLADKRVNQTCPSGSTGSITRQCDSEGSWKEPYDNCVRTEIKQLTNTVGELSKKENPTAEEITNVIAQLSVTTQVEEDPEDVNEKLTSGEVAVLSSSLENIARALNTTNDTTAVTSENITENFFQSCDNLLDSSNEDSWVAQTAETNSGAEKVLQAVDVLTEAIGRNLENETKKTVVKKNLALEVKKINLTEEKEVVFPDPASLESTTEKWITESKSSISLNSDALTDKTVKYVTTAVMYRDLSEILPSTAVNVRNDTNKTPESKDQGSDEEKRINGPILAMSIIPSVDKLDPPISITFQHFEEKLTQPACSFWNFAGDKTGWSTEGCTVASSSEASTVCECNHLTNFAVLMSPFKEVETASHALAVISILGISVSIFCLLLTLTIHAMFWRVLRNERTVILMNLCIALVISNITFLAGINETDNPTTCAVVAAFLQYIYLVVFCVMLVEGVIIALTIVYVFKTARNTKMLLIPAWVVPVFIVGISVLATQAEGYGNKNYCWLSIENGLIWTFVGPVLIILVCNVVCLSLVFRAMFKTTAMETKTAFEKVKTSFRCLCVLLPLMGLSWILGIFYVDGRSAFIQYIFTILNAFQIFTTNWNNEMEAKFKGFFIFLFHCLLNQQVKNALELRVRRFSASHTALRSFSSTSGKDGSGTKYSIPKKDTGKSIDEGTSVAKTEEKTVPLESAQSSV